MEISAVPAARGIDVTIGDLGAPGTVEVYWQNPTRVLRDGRPLRVRSDYAYDATTHRLTVSFTGATKIQIEGGSSLFGR